VTDFDKLKSEGRQRVTTKEDESPAGKPLVIKNGKLSNAARGKKTEKVVGIGSRRENGQAETELGLSAHFPTRKQS